MNRSEALEVLTEVRNYLGALNYNHWYTCDFDARGHLTEQLRGCIAPLNAALRALDMIGNPRLLGVYADVQYYVFSGEPMDFAQAERLLNAAYTFFKLELDHRVIMSGEEQE